MFAERMITSRSIYVAARVVDVVTMENKVKVSQQGKQRILVSVVISFFLSFHVSVFSFFPDVRAEGGGGSVIVVHHRSSPKRMANQSKRIGDHMSDIRLIFGRPVHRCQAPGTVKMQSGQ